MLAFCVDCVALLKIMYRGVFFVFSFCSPSCARNVVICVSMRCGEMYQYRVGCMNPMSAMVSFNNWECSINDDQSISRNMAKLDCQVIKQILVIHNLPLPRNLQ